MSSRRGRECQSEAVVLKVKTIGENDIWVDFLTPDHGRLHGIARHGRKSQKRFGTVLEALNRVRVRYRETGDLVALEESGLVSPLHHLERDLERLAAGFYVLDLIRELLPERNPDPKVYDLLNETLSRIDEDVSVRGSLADVLMTFEYRFLDLCGYGLHFKKCLGCGTERRKGDKFFFVYREGGLYCPACLPASASGGFEPFSRKTLPRILSRFVEYQLGHTPNSRKILTGQGFYG